MTFKEKVNEMKIHHEEHKEERHERHEEKKFAHEIKPTKNSKRKGNESNTNKKENDVNSKDNTSIPRIEYNFSCDSAISLNSHIQIDIGIGIIYTILKH